MAVTSSKGESKRASDLSSVSCKNLLRSWLSSLPSQVSEMDVEKGQAYGTFVGTKTPQITRSNDGQWETIFMTFLLALTLVAIFTGFGYLGVALFWG